MTSSKQFTPTGGQTIFPRINFIKDRTTRLLQRISNGRVAMYFKRLFKDASLDLNFASSKSLVDSVSNNNLITFSRASSGTYVDSDGLIKTSPVNLLKYSEDLSQWSIYNGAAVIPNATTAPDGTTTADLVDLDDPQSFTQINQTFGAQASTTYTVSFYAKAVTGTETIKIYRPGSNGGSVNFVATTEWQRFTNTYTTSASTPYNLVLFLQNNLATNTNQYYLWGAQVEEGTTATDYIPTGATISGEPRFDHDPATGESLGLLLEEARTNLVLNSVTGEIQSATDMTGPTSVYGPGGADTAFQYLSVGGTVGSRIQFKSVVTANSTQYTATIYVKGVNYNTVTFGFGAQGFSGNSRRKFFLDTLTTEGIGGAAAVISIEDAGNGWRRLRITTTATTSATGVTAYIDLGGTGNETHTTDQGFQFYGFQIEAGTFPTSYIPTSGSAVTRSADIVTIEGTNFSSWYNQSEGTLFVEAKSYPHPVTGKALLPLAFSDNTFNNRITLASSTGNDQFNFDVTAGGVAARAILGNFTSSGIKAAGGYKSTGSAGSLDGAAVVTTNTPNIPSVISRLDFGRSHNDGSFINVHIKRFTYFPTRKADQELVNLTS